MAEAWLRLSHLAAAARGETAGAGLAGCIEAGTAPRKLCREASGSRRTVVRLLVSATGEPQASQTGPRSASRPHHEHAARDAMGVVAICRPFRSKVPSP